MNKLIIIGNGFDLAHGLNTKYSDMINFFWDNLIEKCNELNNTKSAYFHSYDDDLISISQYGRSHYDFKSVRETHGIETTLSRFIKGHFNYNIKDQFFNSLINVNNIQNWVDVENEYYQSLLSCLDKNYDSKYKDDKINVLNKSFELMKDLLSKHLLNEMKKDVTIIDNIYKNILASPNKNELHFSTKIETKIEKILIVNFNYTDTIEKAYLYQLNTESKFRDASVEIIHIHGFIKDFDNNPMIFGYGDELDKHSKDIVDLNNSNFLKNIKSINYQFSSNYKKILQFLSYDYFQAVIMGHSCGNSDRTLLNTIFEHSNCLSIKPFYHKWDNGDNYFDIVCNIYRNFTKNASFRERVVEKNLCDALT